MGQSTRQPQRVSATWQADQAGEHYVGARWSSRRRKQHDPRLVTRALAPLRSQIADTPLLDAPCGAGRLQACLVALGGRYVGLDISEGMLAAGPKREVIHGSAWSLPFADQSFGAVVCCRLFHHLSDDSQRASLMTELMRVSSGPVLMSFWDAGSWHAWRRRNNLRRARHPDSRQAISRGHLLELVQQCGGRPLSIHASFRFVSQQTFLLWERAPERTASNDSA